MKVATQRAFLAVILVGLISLFQNCGPAQISVGTDAASSGGAVLESTITVGQKVDLPALLKSAQEAPTNVLYPSPMINSQFDYAQNAPILESLVLLKNDFSRIEWVHGPSSTIVAIGDAFNQDIFSSSLLGTYYIFGFRGQTPFLITQFQIVDKGATTLNVNSVGAVQIIQQRVSFDTQNETFLILAEAPAVDLKSIQIFVGSSSLPIIDKRALLVTKKLSESISVNIKLTDISGQTLTKTINLPLTSTGATPTPTPAPTPVPTPSPVSVDWVPCASEGTTCTFSGVRNVRFGVNGSYFTKYSVSGSILCSNTVFGDPAHGYVKSCDYSAAQAVPAITVSPILVDFGSQALLTSSSVKMVTITNTGTGLLIFPSSFTISGDFIFGAGSTCSLQVSYVPGASCTAAVVFKPTALGPRSGILTVPSNAGPPVSVSILGTGI